MFRSMHGRLFLILLLGIIVTAAGSIALTYTRQHEMYERVHAHQLAAELEELVDMLEHLPPQARAAALRAPLGMGMRGRLLPADAQPLGERDKLLERVLQHELDDVQVAAGVPGKAACGKDRAHDFRRRPGPPLCQQVRLTLPDGDMLALTIPLPPLREMAFPPPSHSALWLFVLCIALLAWLVARIATRPLRQLADAADKLDITRAAEPLPEQGSNEVRAATRAFNRMQQRIYEDVRERTGMLAAITHDLQTPLTRLRLRLEKLPDAALRDKLVGDMQAMQQMLQEGLELSRSMDASEPEQLLDIDSLLDSLCSDAADAGQAVAYTERTAMRLKARPLALRRALSNLIDNAVKYGQRAEISLSRDDRRCHIRIRDFGPGIPPELLEQVFTPFYRIEHSRSRETGGTGLGLSIARNIVQRHNGEISLRNHAAGGLQVDVVLPL